MKTVLTSLLAVMLVSSLSSNVSAEENKKHTVIASGETYSVLFYQPERSVSNIVVLSDGDSHITCSVVDIQTGDIVLSDSGMIFCNMKIKNIHGHGYGLMVKNDGLEATEVSVDIRY